jgi:hypothetical protein
MATGLCFFSPSPLARWPANVFEGSFLLNFGNKQGEATGEAQGPEDAEKVGERDVSVARFEILIALDRNSRAARKFRLGPVAPQTVSPHARQQTAHNGALAGPGFCGIGWRFHYAYFIMV